MFNVFIIAEETRGIAELHWGLAQKGFACSFATHGEGLVRQIIEQAPDLVLVEMNGHSAKMRELFRGIKRERNIPIIAMANKETLDCLDADLAVDDFVINPCGVEELVLRVKRLQQKTDRGDTGELIKCGDLVIDLARCEVTVDGRLAVLTFREYELLKFLVSNSGRVFTREALLNRVWGYDYYGGDRTVDVHVRRLRSKIEDSKRCFIETVRNIGYSFRTDT